MVEEQVRLIRKLLGQPLPGISAQLKMSPQHRRIPELEQTPQKAGVLLLLYPRNDDLTIIFTKRTTYDGPHSGQISLPGGKIETFDSSIIETALREAHEEIGINPSDVEVLGMLTPLIIPVSNFEVAPVVGYMKKPSDFIIDPSEVDYLIEVSFSHLVDPRIVKQKKMLLHDQMSLIPFYLIDDHEIWGATAMIISEFVELIKKA